MIDQRPLKAGQALIHDVRGHGYYTEECEKLQAFNTSKVLMYVDFGDGAGPENVSRACLHLVQVDVPKEFLEIVALDQAYDDLETEGLMTIAGREPHLKKIVVSQCPVCNSQDTMMVEQSYVESAPEAELCHKCSIHLGNY